MFNWVPNTTLERDDNSLETTHKMAYTIKILNFNPLMPGGNKKVHIIKQTCSFQLQVCLNMSDLFVTTRH